MRLYRYISLILVFVAINKLLIAQSSSFFAPRGNNISSVSCGGILYAPVVNTLHQSFGAGACWVRKPADLRLPFHVSFVLDFTDTTAVDGGAFVFQTDSNAVGEAFNGLGYRKIDHSIAITFDPKQNGYDNDPPFDHISIQANGDLNHASVNNLAGPVTIASDYSTSIFPGYPPVLKFHHLVSVDWDPALQTLSASIDKSPVIAVQIDLLQKIFGGNPIVYWGFTSSNTQPMPYDAAAELTFGYLYFFFGDVTPRYYSIPALDTCFIQPVRFFDSSRYASDYSLQDLSLFKWFWSFGDGSESVARDPAPHNYPGPGAYELKFTATNQLGCTTDTLTRIIKLGSRPQVDFSVSAACTQTLIAFEDRSSAEPGIPVHWEWDFGHGDHSGLKNPAFSFTDTGLKAIRLQVSTEFGCEADTVKYVRVTAKPELQIHFVKDCSGAVSYAASVQNGVPVSSWSWSFGDGAQSADSSTSHFYFRDGDYHTKLVAVSESGCSSDSMVSTVRIFRVMPFAGNDTVIASGEPLQLNGRGGTIFSWSPATGLSDPGIPNPVASLTQDQAYILLVKNDDGCEGRDSIRIKVYRGPEFYIPSAFTPNRDGRNDQLRITGPGIRSLTFFRIFDRGGQLVFETRDLLRGWDGSSKGIDQPAGVYVWIAGGVDYKGNILTKRGTVMLIR